MLCFATLLAWPNVRNVFILQFRFACHLKMKCIFLDSLEQCLCLHNVTRASVGIWGNLLVVVLLASSRKRTLMWTSRWNLVFQASVLMHEDPVHSPSHCGNVRFKAVYLQLKKKAWNMNDCWCSKTRPKHVKYSKECLFIVTYDT